MVENERKYVLDPKNKENYKAELTAIQGAIAYDFTQGYLDGNSRIRKSVSQVTGERINYFTYKTKVSGNVIEVETPITDLDFDRLWTKVGKIITKTRIVVPFNESLSWEVDFFRANQMGEYFVMAEIELPEGVEAPAYVPFYIEKHLVHVVDIGDKRFNSRQLTKPVSVAALLTEIRNGKLQPQQSNGK